MRLLALGVLVAGATAEAAGPVGSSRNWQLAIDGLQCSEARLSLEARIRYTGPKGPVESPVVRIADGAGTHHLPRGLAWKQGAKPLAQWLSAGGLANLQSEEVGSALIRFELEGAPAPLHLEFGDLAPILLTAKSTSAAPICARLLKTSQLKRVAPPKAATRKVAMRVYRGAYPCLGPGGTRRTVEAQYPPHLPRQLLVLGRGHLPAAREVDLPMGKAAARGYAYSGANELDAIEDAARRAIAADFPHYATDRHFAFNWGEHRSPAGNPLDSIGLYELRGCRATAGSSGHATFAWREAP